MVVRADGLIHRQLKLPLSDWSKAAAVMFKPKPGMDISKVVFAEFKWVAAGKAPPKPDSNGRVYLSREMAGKTESFLKVMQDQSFDGNAISIDGTTYLGGLGVHAPSEIVFPLEGNYANFHVVPGPDDEHRGSLEMRILVDGKEVYASGKMNSSDKTQRPPLDIPVDGAGLLTLIVTDGGDSNGGDHASWADAYLTQNLKKHE